MGSTAKDVPAVAPVYPMPMEKNVPEVLQVEAVSGKALTPEEVVARTTPRGAVCVAGKWYVQGICVPASGISLVAPGGYSLALKPQREEWAVGMPRKEACIEVIPCANSAFTRRDAGEHGNSGTETFPAKTTSDLEMGIKWLNPNEDGVSVAAPGNSLVAPGGYSLPFLGEPQGEAPFLGGRFMPPVRFMPPPAECVVDMDSANKADGTGEAIPFAKSAFTRRDAGEPGNCGPEIFQANITSDLEMGSNQPTSGDNASSAEVGSTAGSDPWQVSLIVAVLGGVTAAMGLVAAVLGLWKTSNSKKV